MQENLIHKYFEESVKKFPQKPCLQYKENNSLKIITYKEVQTRAQKIANFLKTKGIKPNDPVCLLSENQPSWPIIYLGIIFSGATAVPIDPQIKKKELENIIKDCSSKTIFISKNIYNELLVNFKDIEDLLTNIILIDKEICQGKYVSLEKIMDDYEALTELPETSENQLASILYTSGTTSTPKTVCLSHYNFCLDAKNILKLKLNKEKDNYISILPLYHTYAFMATLLVPLLSGARITFISNFNFQEIISTINETKVTVLVAVPQIFNSIHKTIFEKISHQNIINKFLFGILINLSAFLKINFRLNLGKIIFSKVHNSLGKSLRVLNSGGAKLDKKVYSDLNNLGFIFLNGYGLTETSPVVTLLMPHQYKPGSVGKAIPGVQVKIDNPDDKGIGEILIKGPNVMQGYYKRPDLTAEVIKDGWFYSGDLGFIDRNGFVYITARIKEVIVLSSGKNIYPEEIEALLLECPYIKEACVFGIAKENKTILTEALHACIVPNIDYFKEQKEINIKDKIRWELDNISRGLPSYKHIMSFSIEKDPLPRTHLGKIKRYIVKEIYERSLASARDESAHPLEAEQIQQIQEFIELSDTAKQIINYLSKELKKPVAPDDHLELDLGIDSLSRVELFLSLQKDFGLNIPEEIAADIFTVQELISKIEEFKESFSILDKKESSWKEIINQPLKNEILQKIDLASGISKKLNLFFVKSFLSVIFKMFWKLNIVGIKNLPKKGPYILCPNHASYLDGLAIAASLPIRIEVNTFFFGLSAYFEHKLLSWMVRFLRVISIDPSTRLKDAMQAASFVLKNKKIMCIFPEGQRSIDENIGEFKKGVGILAKELDMPLVPVYIKGSHFAWGRGDKFPRPYPITVTFGKPLSYPELINICPNKDLDEYSQIAEGLRQEVIKLKNTN